MKKRISLIYLTDPIKKDSKVGNEEVSVFTKWVYKGEKISYVLKNNYA